MLRGFYTSAAGMISQQRRQEMLSNNLANANTPGFKADQATLRAFPEMLIARLDSDELPNKMKIPTNKKVGHINTGVYMQELTPQFKQGDIRETGNQTDLALLEGIVPINEETGEKGALFFTVQTETGEQRYTRNGNFTLDANGSLTTNDGYYVLDNQGNQIQILGNEFQVADDGTVLENGIVVGQINIAFAENPNQLIKEQSGLFRLDQGEGQEAAELPTAIGNENVNYSIKQGFVEQSNVRLEQTMTDMMMSYRLFEANQKILKAYDQNMEKTVNEIGRIR